jgi:4-hydroxy-3-polyprenylbenzoate decarboxylase
VTPSESSLIKRIGMEPLFKNFLRDTLGIKGIKRVSMHEPLTNIRKVIALVCEPGMPTEIWRALWRGGAAPRGSPQVVILNRRWHDGERALRGRTPSRHGAAAEQS